MAVIPSSSNGKRIIPLKGKYFHQIEIYHKIYLINHERSHLYLYEPGSDPILITDGSSRSIDPTNPYFSEITDVTGDSEGNLYMSECSTNRIFKLVPSIPETLHTIPPQYTIELFATNGVDLACPYGLHYLEYEENEKGKLEEGLYFINQQTCQIRFISKKTGIIEIFYTANGPCSSEMTFLSIDVSSQTIYYLTQYPSTIHKLQLLTLPQQREGRKDLFLHERVLESDFQERIDDIGHNEKEKGEERARLLLIQRYLLSKIHYKLHDTPPSPPSIGPPIVTPAMTSSNHTSSLTYSYSSSHKPRRRLQTASLLIDFAFSPSDVAGTPTVPSVANRGSLSPSATGTLKGSPLATCTNLAWKSGYTSALSLISGSSQYMSVSSFYLPNTGISFAFWYRSNGCATDTRVFDFGNSGPNYQVIYKIDTDASVTQSSLTSTISTPSSACNQGAWCFIVWTMTYVSSATSQASSHIIYLNGSQYSTASGYYPAYVNRGLNYIGATTNGAGPYCTINGYVFNYANNTYDAQLKNNAACINNVNLRNDIHSAFYFPYATSSYLQLPSIKIPTTGISFVFWSKITGAIDLGKSIIQLGAGASNRNILFLISMNAYVYYTPATYVTKSPVVNTACRTGIWCMFVWTMSYASPGSRTSTTKIYMNNTLIYTNNTFYYPDPTVIRTANALGSVNSLGNGNANVYLANVQMYKNVLTAAQINALFNNGAPEYPTSQPSSSPTLTKKTLIDYTFAQGDWNNVNGMILNRATMLSDAMGMNSAPLVTSVYTAGTKAFSLQAASSQYIRILSPFIPPQESGMTIAVWFRSSSCPANSRVLDLGSGPSLHNIAITPTSSFIVTDNYTANNLLSSSLDISSSPCNANSWCHVVWTLEYAPPGALGPQHIYINGVLAKDDFGYYPSPTNRTKNYIGKSNNPADVYCTMQIGRADRDESDEDSEEDKRKALIPAENGSNNKEETEELLSLFPSFDEQQRGGDILKISSNDDYNNTNDDDDDDDSSDLPSFDWSFSEEDYDINDKYDVLDVEGGKKDDNDDIIFISHLFQPDHDEKDPRIIVVIEEDEEKGSGDGGDIGEDEQNMSSSHSRSDLL
eukprot:gene7471-8058_t